MDVEQVWQRIRLIRNLAHDDEAAHCKEDRLWRDVLETIAARNSDAAPLAKEALKTVEIDFSRWCA